MINLDGAQGLIYIPIFFILHVLYTVLIEGSILSVFKYQKFKKSLLTAFKVNLISLITGLPFISIFSDWSRKLAHDFYQYGLDKGEWLVVIFFFQTILVEYVALILLNPIYPRWKLWGVNLIMNLLTYMALYWVMEELL